MLIAQISDTHIKLPGRLAYGRVDTAAMLRDCVAAINRLDPQPDLVVHTGDLVDLGLPEEYEHLQALLAPLDIPLLTIPGNHDDRQAMRAAFGDQAYLPASGFLQFVIDEGYPLRILGLDTTISGQEGGALCAERLTWLARTLEQAPDRPTLLLMHHPPFATGIGHMDRIGLAGAREFAAVMRRHPQVELVLCGHLHRLIHAQIGGRPALTAPSPAHQVALDLSADGPSCFRLEPPGFMLHRWQDGQMVSHQAFVRDYPGPFPFFDPAGSLID
jgi:3',5'-cyclic-AMP phosphodiesterase